MRVLGIADDLTGALEAGAKFSAAGIESIVTAGRMIADARAVIIDTETRHLAPADAERVVAACADPGASIIYKKTDSTLRGNIGPELRALARAYPGSSIAYVPAYPALGRTVRGGILYVDGAPLHETAFARDRLNPTAQSGIRAMLDGCCDCVIFDGETDDDISRAAAVILSEPAFRIVAGPAAIAEALAARLEIDRRPPQPWPAIRSCIVVNGSLHEASAAQIEHALGCACIGRHHNSWRLIEPGIAPDAESDAVARASGREVRDVLAKELPDAITAFGGDTAFGILQALGCPALRPIGEILPGVPISAIDGCPAYLITKAGGFGTPDLLSRLRNKLDANFR